MRVRKAIIPAAGFGTRMLPATKSQPKEMLPIIDKPTIQYIVEEAFGSGIEEILIITGRNKHSIEDYFDKSPELEEALKKGKKIEFLNEVEKVSNMDNIFFIRQKEMKGLGHAVLVAERFVGKEPFAVLLGDNIMQSNVPCLKQVIDQYDKYKRSIIGVQKVPMEDVNKYGIIKGHKIDGVYDIDDMIEKPSVEEAPSDLAILGRYVFTNEIFEYLKTQEPGKGGEIQLTDSMLRMLEDHEMYALEFEGKCHDVGDKMKFLMATVELALSRDDIKDEFRNYLVNILEK
ncbi:MAG: UTP--glucose-1-phosphate uridylyltransferase GalU [Clostridia bacterium]|jgi:UTP--glucose-1-phosphate uridylyltransferase|nr:UTP--glucose-1-phosphate uridylyltransferase GalU [Clostridia bacterium]